MKRKQTARIEESQICGKDSRRKRKIGKKKTREARKTRITRSNKIIFRKSNATGELFIFAETAW
jgi:hypothetical protein